MEYDDSYIVSLQCSGSRSPDLLKLFYPPAQAVRLDALLAVLGLQLRDGLFLLGGVKLDLLHGATHQAKLLLQR